MMGRGAFANNIAVGRDAEDADDDGELSKLISMQDERIIDPGLGNDSKATEKEISASFALFILICLMIIALFTSYLLQSRKVQAIHETVLSIFGGEEILTQACNLSSTHAHLLGMVIGLILRLTSTQFVQDYVTFNYQLFFNFLLPPIILASGYELHQVRIMEEMRWNQKADQGHRQTFFATLAAS